MTATSIGAEPLPELGNDEILATAAISSCPSSGSRRSGS